MEASYGSWTSPIDARGIAEGGIRLGWPQAVGEAAYWSEMRPLEGGRYAIVRRAPEGTIGDVTPAGVNARTLVHEYGGGMYVAFRNVRGGESVIFSDYADQRLYRQDLEVAGVVRADGGEPGGEDEAHGDEPGSGAKVGDDAEAGAAAARWSAPRPLTPAPPTARAWRYADGSVTPDGRLLVCVRERHDTAGVVNDIVALPADGSSGPIEGPRQPIVVADGHDFFAAPRLSADGRRVAFICWDHPRMPWDGTELRVAEIDTDGHPGASIAVAGAVDESVVQPQWTPDGDLLFVGDHSGWWNLYRLEAPAIAAAPRPAAAPPVAMALAPMAAEFAKPHWVFGLGSFALLDDGSIVAAYTQDGVDHLAQIDRDSVREIETGYTVFAGLATAGARIVANAAGATQSGQIFLVDPRSGTVDVLRRSREIEVDARFISRPEPIAFPTWYERGSVTGPLVDELAGAAGERPTEQAALLAHALFFPPTNPDFAAPPGERPPLLVISHGGPTSAHEAELTMDIQYWTSRGFAVVDVNYGGSSGYGRAYRERLKGNWGVVDTVDCIRAAEFLVARGDVDPDRLAVRGGSAGGYTTLNALTRFDTFAAGASHFGLADLESFVAGGTHKFEERYIVPLVGPYPEAAEVYRERSPIHHVGDIACPVILFQGLEDEIVPPAQAEMIVAALAKKSLPYAYLAFEGEQHGFRKAENIVRCLEAELYFYGKVFGFAPADEIEPVAIANLGE